MSRLSTATLRDGRVVALGMVVAYFAVVLGMAVFRDGIEDWSLLGVPAMPERFADMASVTSAWECDRAGFSVVPGNPCDPLGRPANYPSLWVEASFLGLGRESTVPLGIATAVAFFAAAFYLAGPIGVRHGLLWGAILCSPAVMLGVERGNVDLLLFAACVLALPLLRSSKRTGRIAAHGLLLLAAALKLFPALAFAVLARQPARAAVAGVGTVSLAFLAYAAVRRDEIRAIGDAVPQFTDLSYGASVAFDVWSAVTPGLSTQTAETAFLAVALIAAAGVALFIALRGGRRDPDPESTPRRRLEVDALWIGAPVFVGTFFLINNWNYRLVFVLLAVPLLLRWQGDDAAPLAGGRSVLAVLVLVLWLSAPIPALPLGPSGILPIWNVFAWEELLGWFLAAYLAAALIVTRPRRHAAAP